MTPEEFRQFSASQGRIFGRKGGRRAWSAATPTTCGAGHRHASKMEARVCVRLTLECRAAGARLIQQVRFPLLSIGAKASGKPETICIDFVLVPASGPWRAIDAKAAGRVSRDWRLRTAAFETTYGRTVEECER